jgi:hypothetical protein
MTGRALTMGCILGVAAALIALPLRADDAPAIIDIAIAPVPVLGGQQATTTVATTTDVTSVEVHVAFMRISIPRVAPGRFELVRDVPTIPRLFRRKYNVTFVARSPDGEARTDLTVDVR